MALLAGLAMLMLLFVASASAFVGTSRTTGLIALMVISAAVARLVRQRVAGASFDGHMHCRTSLLFVLAGSLFLGLAVAAPMTTIIASGTYVPLRMVDGRSLPMIVIAAACLLFGLGAALRGLIAWATSPTGWSARLVYAGTSDVVEQTWALIVLVGTIFILY